ncbi:MAG: rhodanese-like domain-containing protein [Actinomycetota bacterium]
MAGGRRRGVDSRPDPPTDIDPDATILGTRQAAEWSADHVPGATHIELGDLASSPGRGPADGVVHCGHGQRAMTAASIPERDGRKPAAVTAGGPREITRALEQR